MSRPLHPVILKRQSVLIITRLVAALLIVAGAIALTYSLVNGFTMGAGFRGMFFMYDNTNWGAAAFALLLPGIALALGSARAARWIVPPPRDECPRCAYPLRSLKGDRCPECGFDFSVASPRAPHSSSVQS
jgi:hypothetical protein